MKTPNETTPKQLRLYKGRKNISVRMEHLFKTVNSISAAGKQDEFLKLCGDQGLTVSASPKVVNAVKTHLFEAGAHLTDPHAAQVATSTPPPPGQAPHCFPE